MEESKKIEILSNVIQDTILINGYLYGIYVESSSIIKIENNVISNL